MLLTCACLAMVSGSTAGNTVGKKETHEIWFPP